ncbi:MAG: hypothetical protein H7320_16925 [Ferruginibacter sp.]|nr:hypothetical protein [Ferruginibacter sp.]
MSITQNKNRIGNPTSSNIYKLMSNGKAAGSLGAPAFTYIQECNIERKLGRSISTDITTRDMSWGLFLERRVASLLEFGYELESQITKTHPTIPYWAGSADMIMAKVKIGDIKCFQPKNFALFTDVLLQNDAFVLKMEYPKEYWQLVSNAIINGVPNAEAISYMPYQSELDEIRWDADEDEDEKYSWIATTENERLAYLPNGGYYKNLNRFEFEVPQDDIEALTARVILAGTMLIDIPSVVIAEPVTV